MNLQSNTTAQARPSEVGGGGGRVGGVEEEIKVGRGTISLNRKHLFLSQYIVLGARGLRNKPDLALRN